MKFLTLLRAVLVFSAVVFAAAIARAEDLGAVKARMSQRLSQLDALRSAGAVGENNRGFTEVRVAGADAADAAGAENSDRETVYAAIAKQTGSPAETVGRARAKQIAAASARGVWIQREDGSWVKK